MSTQMVAILKFQPVDHEYYKIQLTRSSFMICDQFAIAYDGNGRRFYLSIYNLIH